MKASIILESLMRGRTITVGGRKYAMPMIDAPLVNMEKILEQYDADITIIIMYQIQLSHFLQICDAATDEELHKIKNTC